MAEPEEIAGESPVAAEPAAASPKQPEPSTRPVSRPSRFERYVRRVISGSILADAEVQKHYPYVLFMAVLMFLYIANGFHTQKLHRQHERLTARVKEPDRPVPLRFDPDDAAARRLRLWRYNGDLLAHKRVKQRGLAHVGPARQGDEP